MKTVLLVLLTTLSCCYLHAQKISQLEYFVDLDPGYGNGTTVSITPATELNNFSFNVPIASLTDGLHTLYVRTKNENNRWSTIQNRPFIKLAVPPAINRVEYFIDTDPGYGNGTAVSFTAGTFINNFVFNIPLTSYSNGLHTLYVRIKDINNKWSTVQSSQFVKLSVASTVSRIEYFIDSDPGYGNGTAVSFTPGTSVDNLMFNIPLTTVSEGLHTLYIRVKDSNNKWSVIQSTIFVNIPATPNIIKVEYYIDTDPGLGNGVNVPLTPATTITDLNFTIDVSTLTEGAHKLFVRAKNAKERWSSVRSETFAVCNLGAPVLNAATEISATGFTITWPAVPGASSYIIEVSKDDFATSISKSTTETSLSITELIPSSIYKCRVRSVGNCTSAFSNVLQVMTANKSNQTITFNPIADKVFSDGSFTLSAVSSSGLTVTFSTTSDKITLSGSTVSFLKAGRTAITAAQEGNQLYNAATPVSRSFCINPVKPTIKVEQNNTESVRLVSNSTAGNQWYKNGVLITNATSSVLEVTEPATYKVQVVIDDCVSEFSEDIVLSITDVESVGHHKLYFYPNPAVNEIYVLGLPNNVQCTVISIEGKEFETAFSVDDGRLSVDVKDLPAGLYLLTVGQSSGKQMIKFIKK